MKRYILNDDHTFNFTNHNIECNNFTPQENTDGLKQKWSHH